MTNPNQSHVSVTPGGTSYVGPDAVNLYRAKVLMTSLSLYAKTGMIPTRGVTAMVMLKMAQEYTGKTYKRGQHAQAAEDVKVWVNTMQTALPITIKSNKTVKRSELASLLMVAGNEKKYSVVIDGGRIKEWVGIGWIDIGAPTHADLSTYYTVED